MCDSQRYSTREELESIFGEQIIFPDEDEAIYNQNFRNKCQVVVYDGETELPLITIEKKEN